MSKSSEMVHLLGFGFVQIEEQIVRIWIPSDLSEAVGFGFVRIYSELLDLDFDISFWIVLGGLIGSDAQL